MKNTITSKGIISSSILSLAMLLTLNSSAQNSTQKPGWTAKPFDHRVFIENKGQFDKSTDDATVPVRFGARVEGMETYFTATGVCYQHGEVVLLNEHQKDSMIALKPSFIEKKEGNEKSEEAERYHFSKVMPRFLKMEWIGCDPNAHVETKDLVSNYFTYPKDKSVNSETYIAQAYEKITYKNIYPNIDIEYIIPKDKDGTKYSIILHPGADLSLVKMKYTYAKKIKINKGGDVEIESSFGDFVDHAPITFYQENNQKVNSSFELNGNVVSFKTDNYDKTKTLVVDPWTTNPAFVTWDRGYDVVFDRNGNVWTYGGAYPWQLEKFSPAGAILWTYNAVAMYNSGCCTGSCYGDVAIDETSGSAYLSEGFDWSSGSRVFKVNTAGVQVLASVGNPNFNEIWRMEYNRCINVILGAGGGTSLVYQGIVIDTTFTTMTPVNSYNANSNTDNWGISIDPVANWLYMCTVSPSPNPMIRVPVPALAPFNWSTNSGFSFSEISSALYVTNGCCANGYNGMSASLNWLYMTDGSILKKVNKTTGAIVNTTPTGGTMFASGGTTTDICDNVYVGIGSQIKEYDPALSLISTLAAAGTIYDVKIGPNNGKIYASGDGFVQELTIPISTSSIALTTTPNTNCTNCNGTATANITICGQPNTTVGYTWAPTAQTTQTATGLCAGLYTIVISTACGVTFQDTITVQGTGNGGFSLTMTSTGANCSNGVATATATPTGGNAPFVYSWTTSPVQTNQTATGLTTGTYTCYVTDANGCTGTSTVTVTNSPPVTLAFQNGTPASCFGGCNGTATVLAGGGTAPFAYAWTTLPIQTVANATGLCAGTYTCMVTDANGCTDTVITTVTQPTAITVNCLPATICNGGNATLNAIIGGGTPNYVITWNPGNLNGASVTVNPTVTTTYTITVTDANGCVSLPFQVTVTVAGPLGVVISPATSICAGGSTTLVATASGGNTNWTYLWTPGNQTTSSITVTPTVTTTYTVTIGDNCPSPTVTATVTITVNPLPTIAFVANDSSGCVPLCVTFTNSSSSTFSSSWTFGDGGTSTSTTPTYCYNTPGTFSVSLSVTDVNGCSNSLTVNNLIHVYPIPVAGFTMTPQTTSIYEPDICFTNTSTGANTYTWDFNDPICLPSNNVSNLLNPCHSYADTGAYCPTLMVENSNGCRDTVTMCLRITDVFTFYAPNSFTPNADGYNDFWFPNGVNIDPNDYKLWIFDRWGNLIWSSTTWLEPWPGTANGGKNIVQEDVYVWKVRCRDAIEHKQHQFIGHVAVVK